MRFVVVAVVAISALAVGAPEKQSLLRRYPPRPLLNEVVAFRPVEHHHVNLEAPNTCGNGTGGAGLLVSASETGVECQFTSRAYFEPKIYVCDDANTQCTTVRVRVSVAGASLGESGDGYHPKRSAISPNPGIPGFIHNDRVSDSTGVRSRTGRDAIPKVCSDARGCD